MLSGVILILVLLALGISASMKKTNALDVETVKREALVNTVEVNGNYTVALESKVISPAKGVITEIFVRNNDEVKKDDKLFHVESTASSEEKAKAYSDYLLAKTALDSAKATQLSLQAAMFEKWEAFKELAESDDYEEGNGTPKYTNRAVPEFHISEKEWLSSEESYKNQQTVVMQAQAALHTATLHYQATQDITVTSPASGTIVNFGKKVNDQVLGDASPVLIIVDLRNPSIVTSINEVNITRVAVGQKAKIVFDALPDNTYQGVVESIDTVGTEMQGTITYNVRIVMTDVIPEVKPGMTAQVSIETFRKENALTVSNLALIKKDGKTYVRKTSGKNNDLTEVEIGTRGLTKTEVLRGISEGDKILIPEE